jgi:hypothetical protein
MNLNDIKKMVVNSLIQERVGYYGAMDGDAGGPADPPDIQDIVDNSEQEMKQLLAAQDNILDAVAAEIAELAAPALIQAGVPGDFVVEMVADFLTQMHTAVEKAKEKRKEASVDLAIPTDTAPEDK